VAATVSLSLVLHNHQPVGNFGWVIEDVYEHAYSPMLHALERHPGIRVGLHYTGPLLRWMAANRPEAIEQIRKLVDRRQVEIVGGGLYEPILVTLPDRDRHGQLVRMRDELEQLFGQRPDGAWLAERVWEPSLAYDLAAAGYRWTVLDDNHLRGASILEDEMWTSFTTDDRGLRLTVFGTEQGLRYRIPFKPVDDLIAYLAARRTDDGRFVGMMGDDGEKFGAWPGTFDYCWDREHWVDRCFEALESNSDWLKMVTPSGWLAGNAPTARAYFPTASYVEMTEWVLPPDEMPTFMNLLDTARRDEAPEARYLRGGFWRNYMVRYREINDLNKQMLRVSDKVAAMASGPEKERAADHLYQGQSNDCYWHGLFGGIYIVHMRMATLSHLIAAEDLADAAADAAGSPTVYGARLFDTDLDAIDEVLATSPGQTLVVDVAEGAGISSWDLRASRVALNSVLRRRPEAYHHKLIEHDHAIDANAAPEGTATDPDAQAEADAGADAPKSIHDVVHVKEPGLAALLHYDRHERRSGLIHLLPADGSTTVEDFIRSSYHELGDFVDTPYRADVIDPARIVMRRDGHVLDDVIQRPLTVTKTIRLGVGRKRLDLWLEFETEVANTGDAPVAFELAVEWNVNLMGGGHNPAAFYESAAGRTPHDVAGSAKPGEPVAFGNDTEGVGIAVTSAPEAPVAWYPVDTISNSEGGFERVYQGSSMLFRWPVSVAPAESRAFTIRFGVSQSIDLAATEAE